MTMLPRCDYKMADYFIHFPKVATMTDADKLPKIFFVSWFRRDDNGGFPWPGCGKNSNYLK
jgi:phosphoenolpyruvate carboxykinase (GTP)